MTTKASQAPKGLIGFLNHYLVERAPFQIPDNAREWIVKFGPWITIVLMILTLPVLFVALGIGTALMPFGGIHYATGFTFQAIGAVVQIGLTLAALPGLFVRRMNGWQLLFYASLANGVFSLLGGSIVGAIVGAVISLYILFQVRPLYHA
jgi:hypothetical protein